MMRIVFSVAAFLSPFFFPFPLALILSCVAGFFLPAIPLMVGVLVDVLYYVPEASLLPLGTLSGVALAVGCSVVRQFVKARIIT